MISVGSWLYVAIEAQPNTATYPLLIAINKHSGAWKWVAGSAATGGVDGGYEYAQFTNIVGIAADGLELLVADLSTTGTTLRTVSTPEVHFADTLLLPDNNPITGTTSTVGSVTITTPALSAGPVPTWNPATGLCTSNCMEIYQWRQARYESQGGYTFWHAVECSLSGCMPEDYERDLIKQVVDVQGVFNPDGTLRPDWVADQLVGQCWEVAARPSTSCEPDIIRQAAGNMDYYAQLALDTAAFLANRPGGTRTPLTPEQQAAKAKFEELAAKACANAPRIAGESPTAYGNRAHKEFERLVKAENNPKLLGETGYLGGGLTPRGGSGTKGSSFPDGVYPSALAPELIVDLKTGLKGIEPWWVTRLGGNLPLGSTNIPVFKLKC